MVQQYQYFRVALEGIVTAGALPNKGLRNGGNKVEFLVMWSYKINNYILFCCILSRSTYFFELFLRSVRGEASATLITLVVEVLDDILRSL